MTFRSYRILRERADRLLFLLHGWSSEQHHLAAYVPLVDPDERFSAICPRAPLDVPVGDGASWYDRIDGRPVADSFRDTLDQLETFIETETERAAVARERCVIGGFSQGGFLALALAARPDAARWGGVWAMCCALPDVDGLELDLARGAGTPALIQVGERDPIIPAEKGLGAARALGDAGWHVTECSYDMGHTQQIEMMVDARAWLAAI